MDELGVKPFILNEGTRRLGRATGVGPRKLLVRLASEAAALELIKSSKKLRNSSDAYIANKIYINPDLTKEEAKQAFERRQARRQTVAAARVHDVGEIANATTTSNDYLPLRSMPTSQF